MIIFLNFWCFSIMVFGFTQWWVDDQPGNEYFLDKFLIFWHPWHPWLKMKFERDWSNSLQCAIHCSHTHKLNYPHQYFCHFGAPVPSEAPLCSFLLETDKNCAFFSSTFMMASVEFGLGCEFPVLECKGLSCGSIIRQSTIYYAGLLERWSKRIIDKASDVLNIIFFSSFLAKFFAKSLLIYSFISLKKYKNRDKACPKSKK